MLLEGNVAQSYRLTITHIEAQCEQLV